MASVVLTRNDARPEAMCIEPDDADGACREIRDLLFLESEWLPGHGTSPKDQCPIFRSRVVAEGHARERDRGLGKGRREPSPFPMGGGV